MSHLSDLPLQMAKGSYSTRKVSWSIKKEKKTMKRAEIWLCEIFYSPYKPPKSYLIIETKST